MALELTSDHGTEEDARHGGHPAAGPGRPSPDSHQYHLDPEGRRQPGRTTPTPNQGHPQYGTDHECDQGHGKPPELDPRRGRCR